MKKHISFETQAEISRLDDGTWLVDLGLVFILHQSLSWGTLCPHWQVWVTRLCLQPLVHLRNGVGWLSPLNTMCCYQKKGGWIGGIKKIMSIKLPLLAQSTSCLFLEPKSSHSLLSTNIFVFAPCLSSSNTSSPHKGGRTISNWTCSLQPGAAHGSGLASPRVILHQPQQHVGSPWLRSAFFIIIIIF